ncbi:MAG: leucine-rich repeat domain-containing protein [Clostridiales bacterium]|nr:leucine-rich repeat domain-containing protein [Clostridiales bacterium]
MKATFRRAMLAVFGLIIALSLFALAACGGSDDPKTESKKAKLILDAGNGGTIAVTEYDVTVGASLSAFLADKTPTPESGLEFGGWFDGGDKLADGAKMPKGGLTLTAKYLASYTVNIYKQNVDGTYGEPESEKGKSWYGESFTYVPTVKDYVIDEGAQNSITSSALGKSETFTVYLARAPRTVTYYLDGPDGAAGEPEVVTGFYGKEVVIAECGVQNRGYRFSGWATVRGGEPVYAVGDSITLDGDVALYATWEKGYGDIHGGADYIFLPKSMSGKAVLWREGLGEKVGVYNESTRIFTFTPIEGKTLSGRISASGGTFAWYDEAMHVTYKGAEVRTGDLIEGVTLELDGYDGAAFPIDGVPEHGVFTTDRETGELRYISPHSGGGFYFRVDKINGVDVFYMREAVYGTYYTPDGDGYSLPKLELDGYGVAVLTDEYGSTTGTYNIHSADAINIVFNGNYYYYELYHEDAWNSATGESIRIGVFIERDGKWGKYTGAGGETLELDGVAGAAYTKASGDIVGGKYVKITEYDDELMMYKYTLISFTSDDGVDIGFVLYSKDNSFTVVGGEAGEYYISFAAGEYNTSKLRLYGDGKAEVLFLFESYYGDYNYEVGMIGTYEPAEIDGAFSFAMTSVAYGKTLTDDVLEQYGEFVFVVGKAKGVPYFSQYSEDAKLTVTDGGKKLVLDGFGRAIYTDGSGDHHCFVEIDHTLYHLVGINTNESFNIVLNYSGASVSGFTVVGDDAGRYLLYQNAYIGPDYIFIDGDGNAVLGAYTDGELTETVGTYTVDKNVYTFTADGVKFTFVLDELVSGGTVYYIYIKEDAALNHIYNVEGGGIIVTDEYGEATWIDSTGKGYFGMLAEENGLLLFLEKVKGRVVAIYTFEVIERGKEESTVVKVGAERGTYSLLDGDIIRETTLVLDGHGGAKIYDEGKKLVASGTYNALGNNEYEFIPSSGGDGFNFIIALVNTNDATQIGVYVVVNDEWKLTLLSATAGDWSVMILDGGRTAYYINERGVISARAYEVLDETVYRLMNPSTGKYDYFRLNRAAKTFTEIVDDFVLSDDGTVLLAYIGSATEVVVPDSVIEIGGSAFNLTNVTSVDLKNVRIIGESAFEWCSYLVSVNAPNVRIIEKYGFFGNIFLEEISLPMIEKVGEAAFRECDALKTVVLGDKLISIGARAFTRLAWTSFTLVLEGGTLPDIAKDEEIFNAKYAQVRVQSVETALAFYSSEAWSKYSACVCIAEAAPASYYTVKLDGAFVLDGRAKVDGTVLGVYEKSASGVTVYLLDGSQKTGTFGADGALTYEGIVYMLEGTEVTYRDEDTDTTLVFALGYGTVEGTYGGAAITLTIGDTITFELEGVKYTVTLKDGFIFSVATPFEPYSCTYNGKTVSASKLVLQFNDAAGTDVTVSDGTTMRVGGRSVRYQAGGTVTYQKPVKVGDGVYSLNLTTTIRVNGASNLSNVIYHITITLNDEDKTFEYTSSIEYEISTVKDVDGTLINMNGTYVVSLASDAVTVIAVSLTLDGHDAVVLDNLSDSVTTSHDITVDEVTYTATITSATGHALTIAKAA